MGRVAAEELDQVTAGDAGYVVYTFRGLAFGVTPSELDCGDAVGGRGLRS